MKKHIVILSLLLWSFTVSAQLKVAILEPVDKGQNVSYGVKLLLRSSLTSSISNTPGYEGYDRVDMASIAGEQDFQRTGHVSDDQIKQLGVATGAAYVLVAEAAKYDATSIIITAKILDVETFGVKSSAVLVSGISADEMQKSCAILSSKLLGGNPNTNTRQSRPVTQPMNNAAIRETPNTKGSDIKYLTTLPNGAALYVASQDEFAMMDHGNAVAACACKGEGWRLPTSQELLFISGNRFAIGGFDTEQRYWSLEGKKSMLIDGGKLISTPKSALEKVRCVKEVKQ